MVACALWNFCLEHEGLRTEYDFDQPDEPAPVLGEELPEPIPPDHDILRPTRENILRLYFPRQN